MRKSPCWLLTLKTMTVQKEELVCSEPTWKSIKQVNTPVPPRTWSSKDVCYPLNITCLLQTVFEYLSPSYHAVLGACEAFREWGLDRGNRSVWGVSGGDIGQPCFLSGHILLSVPGNRHLFHAHCHASPPQQINVPSYELHSPCDKILDNLKEERMVWAHSLRVQSVIEGKAWW